MARIAMGSKRNCTPPQPPLWKFLAQGQSSKTNQISALLWPQGNGYVSSAGLELGNIIASSQFP